MNSGRLTVVLGIRPDVIRAALILRQLKDSLGSNFRFVWSGQHYSDNMKDIFFRQLEVPMPDVSLNLDTSSDTNLIGSLISQLGEELSINRPDAIVYLGDTNTVVSSLAAASLDIPIVHIEGCMRSYDWRMPEEKFRTTIDHLADVIYAYLPEYKEQGLLEGLRPEQIVVTGNPIVDILDHYFLSGKVRLPESDISNYLTSLGIDQTDFWTMTCHRRENVESKDALLNIFNLAREANSKVLFAAGYRTQSQIKHFQIEIPENVVMVDPIGYAELMELMVRSNAVITDSGTVVEEAAVLGVPSIQMRTSTERPQVYDCGGSGKIDTPTEVTKEQLAKVIQSAKTRKESVWSHTLGDGTASKKIVDDLLRRLTESDWNGHAPDPIRRPIARNFGTGLNNEGDF